jgi:hypothetical protein
MSKTAKERVLEKWPKAEIWTHGPVYEGDKYSVFTNPTSKATKIGHGKTIRLAWRNASQRLTPAGNDL